MRKILCLIGALIFGALAQIAPAPAQSFNPFTPDFAWCNNQGSVAARFSSAWGCLTPGTPGQVLISGGPNANVSWSTVTGTGTVTSVQASGGTTGLTFSGGPITGSGTLTMAGTLGDDNGGTGFNTYAAGDMIYASATNTLAKLATVAPCSGTFAPVLQAGTPPVWGCVTVRQNIGGTGIGLSSSGGSGTGVVTITNTGVLTVSGGTTGLTPNTATTGAVTLAGTLVETNGGTNQTTYTTGDILYASGANTLAKLPAGSVNQVLKMTGGVPVWGSGVVLSNVAGNGITVSGATGNVTITANLTGSNGIAVTPGAATNIAITAGALPGVATNSAATAGTIGEYVKCNASPASPASGVIINMCSISLTAGDWDIQGAALFNPTGVVGAKNVNVGISNASAAFSAPSGSTYDQGGYVASVVPAVTLGDSSISAGSIRALLASTTTIYGVVRCYYTAPDTCPFSGGGIQARRVR